MFHEAFFNTITYYNFRRVVRLQFFNYVGRTGISTLTI